MRRLSALPSPLIFTGSGLSWSVALTCAALCREARIAAFALGPADIASLTGPGTVISVSRSGSRPTSACLLLGPTDGDDIVLPVGDPDDGRSPWLPVDHAIAVIAQVRLDLAIARGRPVDVSAIGQFNALIVERHAHVAQAAFDAVADKLRTSRLRALDRDQVGHGFHAKLATRGGSVLLLGHRALGDTPLGRWAADNDIDTQDYRTVEPMSAGDIFEVAVTLAVRAARCAPEDVHQCPLPADQDWLRDADTVRDWHPA